MFHVVVNQRGQYSIWPAVRAIPAGWTPVTEAATREVCLRYIEEHWTDITDVRPPRSAPSNPDRQ